MHASRTETPWSTMLSKSSRRAGMSRAPSGGPDGPRKKFWKNKTFWVALTAIGTVAAAGVGVIALLESRQDRTPGDPQKPALYSAVCESQTYASHAQGFLIDVSDPFANDNIRDRLVRAAQDDLREAPRGSAVIVAGLNDSAIDPINVTFTACNPGSPEEIGTLFNNTHIAERNYEAFMLSALGNLTRHFDPGEKQTSPICEGIRELSRQPEMHNAQTRRITVVSDLMQFTNIASVYQSGPRFLGQYPQGCQTDLTGYEFQLLIIPRDHVAQTDELIRFWVQSLEEMGAVVTAATRR